MATNLKLVEKIETHFAAIGGLHPLRNRQTPARSHLEHLIGKRLDPLLATVWTKYQGMMFCQMVVLKNLSIPIASRGIVDIAGFLPLDDTLVNEMQIHQDLFADIFVPFAEGLPGDFIAVHKDNGNIYYILHDSGENEETAYLLFSRFEDFCLGLTQEKEEAETSGKLISIRLDTDLLGNPNNQ